MKKRNPLAVILLSIVTLGVYDIYWLVQTKKVLNEKTRHHTPSIWLLCLPVLILIVGYGLLIFSAASPNGGSDEGGSAVLSLILIVLGFISLFVMSFIWFFKFSKAVNEYTQGKMSTAVSFLLLWILHLIGVAFIQDAFNDMIDEPSNQAQPQAPAPLQPLPQAPHQAAAMTAPTQPPANIMPQ